MKAGEKQTGYPSIDKPWLKYYTEEDLAIRIPQCTVWQNIYDRNKDHSKDIAIQYYGNKISYGSLFSHVETCARALRQIGIQSGDCVTLCSAGVPEAIYLVLACSRIGAIANFINPLFTREQMRDRINDTEAKWIFVLDAMYSYIEAALPETCVQNIVIIPATSSVAPLLSWLLSIKGDARRIIGHGNGKQRFLLWKDFCAFSRDYSDNPDEPYLPDRPAVMVYSSGSTGASKGILLTNDGINATISKYDIQRMSFMRGDSFLQMIPVWFSTGIVYSVLMPLANGMKVIPEPKFSKESFLKDLSRYKPSITLTATSLWIHVANSGKRIDLSNMKYPITGGEKILPQDEAKIKEYLRKNGCRARFSKGYGMCELGSEITGVLDAPGYIDKPGGCGYPVPKATVSAFDLDTGKELPYGQHGEIRVLSPARMKGYYKNPEATARFFKTDAQGNVWGCTGDIGYVDEDGEVFILGRATDHFRRADGQIVFLFDIEEQILKDEAVTQCKVIHADRASGERLIAHVVLDQNGEKADAVLARIHRRVKQALPDHMVPDYYKVRTVMPVHTNGKRDVDALRKDMENLISADSLANP